MSKAQATPRELRMLNQQTLNQQTRSFSTGSTHSPRQSLHTATAANTPTTAAVIHGAYDIRIGEVDPLFPEQVCFFFFFFYLCCCCGCGCDVAKRSYCKLEYTPLHNPIEGTMRKRECPNGLGLGLLLRIVVCVMGKRRHDDFFPLCHRAGFLKQTLTTCVP